MQLQIQRRQFVIAMRIVIGLVMGFLLLGTTSAETPEQGKSDLSRPIRVLRPLELPATLPAERISIAPGYKPTMARLPNGELVLMFFRWERGDGYHEFGMLSRSTDNGKTWSVPQRVRLGSGQDLLGRENWLTLIDDGTPGGLLLTTNHIIRADSQNPTPGTCRATINRSTDGGKTWIQTLLPAKWSHTSRNIVQMPDGSLKVGANNVTGGNNRWLTSTDGGRNWTESQLQLPGYTTYQGKQMEYDNEVGFFQESFIYLNGAGELLQWIRLDRGSPMYAMHAEEPTGNDNADRLIFTKSTDGGATWSNVEDFPKYTGTLEPYGQMYPRVTPLDQGRILMTYTKRSGTPPLGLRAILSTAGGDKFNSQNDVLILDENTQPGWTSGGGFGNTIQLSDDSLISCYSYATTPGGNEHPHTEVVRWRLPGTTTSAASTP